ncbi:unnamed protein product [Spirodela intermedia]|uniref:Uncharacterized protein n=1 Tax=Spirodela intermedia TaxID=51605 RepID=A0A7I8KVY0_SPIIN|nr:unnamed protein product [Spirodela intermedia]
MADPPPPASSAGVRLLAVFLLLGLAVAEGEGPQTYIVHVSPSHKPAGFPTRRHWYASTLAGVSSSSSVPAARIIYTYDRAATGFAAVLTPSQAEALRRLPAILAVEPDRAHQVHTTHTPVFLGLSEVSGLWPNSQYADNVVIGVLDTGIWPERGSFSDEGLSPVPSSWRGVCEAGDDFPATSCNRKLIGARAFYKGYVSARGYPIDGTVESKSPRDTEGHGTHTASTAAGSTVAGAGLFGYAAGVARGMATKARIAVYKICWSLGCFDSDILAAMDSAVSDGVDVISLSVGANGYAPNYYRDSIAIGAFGAVSHGVVVSCSAGNSGPGAFTAVNIAPWILTVGASSIDRDFPADAVLGDGSIYTGVSLYSGDGLGDGQLPLVYAGDCGSRLCISGRLDPEKVAGKIVLCDRGSNARVEKGSAVKLAGGAGMILANTDDSGEELVADAHLVPATMVGKKAGNQIRNYTITSPASPTATILFRGTVTGPSLRAPSVAAFSSRGPNIRTQEILKPDVIAPGVNILASWTGAASPTDLEIDPRRVDFNIISGTSMSCPHVSGLAALLRKAYPNWSPAAIKSALMTTAYNADNSGGAILDLATGGESTPFVRGAGHVDPNRALEPGLVYDIDTADYVSFLCTIGYSPLQIAIFVKDLSVDCSGKIMASPGDLNYPSFSIVFDSVSTVVTYSRKVRNVGGETGEVTYEAEVSPPAGVEISVNPSKLVFSGNNQTISYTVTFSTQLDPARASPLRAFGSLAWKDGVHVVRSPIAFHWTSAKLDASM